MKASNGRTSASSGDKSQETEFPSEHDEHDLANFERRQAVFAYNGTVLTIYDAFILVSAIFRSLLRNKYIEPPKLGQRSVKATTIIVKKSISTPSRPMRVSRRQHGQHGYYVTQIDIRTMHGVYQIDSYYNPECCPRPYSVPSTDPALFIPQIEVELAFSRGEFINFQFIVLIIGLGILNRPSSPLNVEWIKRSDWIPTFPQENEYWENLCKERQFRGFRPELLRSRTKTLILRILAVSRDLRRRHQHGPEFTIRDDLSLLCSAFGLDSIAPARLPEIDVAKLASYLQDHGPRGVYSAAQLRQYLVPARWIFGQRDYWELCPDLRKMFDPLHEQLKGEFDRIIAQIDTRKYDDYFFLMYFSQYMKPKDSNEILSKLQRYVTEVNIISHLRGRLKTCEDRLEFVVCLLALRAVYRLIGASDKVERDHCRCWLFSWDRYLDPSSTVYPMVIHRAIAIINRQPNAIQNLLPKPVVDMAIRDLDNHVHEWPRSNEDSYMFKRLMGMNHSQAFKESSMLS